MDAIGFLTQDHDLCRKLLAELEVVSEEKKADLFGRFRETLIKHVNVEEEVFYPHLMKNQELQETVLEAWEDHNLCMQLLQEMDERDIHEKVWRAKLGTLTKLTLTHLLDEEETLFPQVRSLCRPEFLESLGQEMKLHQKAANPEEILYPEVPESHRPWNIEGVGPSIR